MSNSETAGKKVVLGRIGKAHGVRGWVRLDSFTTPVDRILEYPEFMLPPARLARIVVSTRGFK